MNCTELLNRAADPLRRMVGRWRRIQRECDQLRAWTKEDEQRRTFYSRFIRPNDLVFDVGANLGNRTKVFLRLGARVIAFEPQDECCAVLRRAFAGNSRVTVKQTALGSVDGTAEMYVGSAHTLTSLSKEWIAAVRESGRFSGYEWRSPVVVATRSLDSMIREYGRPRFIKVDVEGYEQEVLSGLTTAIPFVSFEFTPERIAAARDCLDLLSSIGPIEGKLSLGESMDFTTTAWASREELHSLLECVDRSGFGDVYVRSVAVGKEGERDSGMELLRGNA